MRAMLARRPTTQHTHTHSTMKVWCEHCGKLFVGDVVGYESIHNFQFNAIHFFFIFFCVLCLYARNLPASVLLLSSSFVLSIYIELFFFAFIIEIYVFSVWFFLRISFLRYFCYCSPISLFPVSSFLCVCVCLFYLFEDLFCEALLPYVRYLHNAQYI